MTYEAGLPIVHEVLALLLQLGPSVGNAVPVEDIVEVTPTRYILGERVLVFADIVAAPELKRRHVAHNRDRGWRERLSGPRRHEPVGRMERRRHKPGEIFRHMALAALDERLTSDEPVQAFDQAPQRIIVRFV
ncbi:hypothetical protein [Nitrobacter hamburgensis]|uniref:hypothetical protein n=1 Tax=Nitrobacter hamburgensis TaxID=912 RepID=UPI0012ED16B1|nr:hypothetical protein [Nitrobacter hamburgensis]